MDTDDLAFVVHRVFICVHPCLSVVENEIEQEESGFPRRFLAD
jgi:hypothetical protein